MGKPVTTSSPEASRDAPTGGTGPKEPEPPAGTWFYAKAIALIMVGCCMNNASLEMVTKYAESQSVSALHRFHPFPQHSLTPLPAPLSPPPYRRRDPGCGNMLTFLQFLSIALAALPSVLARVPGSGALPSLRLKSRLLPLRAYAVLSGLFWLVSVLNNVAFGFSISVPMHTVFRSASLPMSLLVGALFFRRGYKSLEVLACLLVTVGTVTVTLADARALAASAAAAATSTHPPVVVTLPRSDGQGQATGEAPAAVPVLPIPVPSAPAAGSPLCSACGATGPAGVSLAPPSSAPPSSAPPSPASPLVPALPLPLQLVGALRAATARAAAAASATLAAWVDAGATCIADTLGAGEDVGRGWVDRAAILRALGLDSATASPQELRAAVSGAARTLARWLLGVALMSLALVLSAYMGHRQQDLFAGHKQGAAAQEALFYSHALALPGFLLVADAVAAHLAVWLWVLPAYALPLPAVLASAIHAAPAPLAALLAAFGVAVGPASASAASASAASPSLLLHPLWAVALNIVSQFACVSGVYRLTSSASTLTTTLVITCRKFVSVLLSVAWFAHAFSRAHWLGTAVVFLGTAVYALPKILAPAPAPSPHPAPAPAEEALLASTASTSVELGSDRSPSRPRKRGAAQRTVAT